MRREREAISLVWIPSHGDFDLSRRAEEATQRATEPGRLPEGQHRRAKSTVINGVRTKRESRMLLDGIGKYPREIDMALPGKHTRTLYDNLKRGEASVLAQLRTGMTRLNGYLHQIGVSESDIFICGQAMETVKHFLFRYTRWDEHRRELFAQTNTRRGNLSNHYSGRPWFPLFKFHFQSYGRNYSLAEVVWHSPREVPEFKIIDDRVSATV